MLIFILSMRNGEHSFASVSQSCLPGCGWVSLSPPGDEEITFHFLLQILLVVLNAAQQVVLGYLILLLLLLLLILY